MIHLRANRLPITLLLAFLLAIFVLTQVLARTDDDLNQQDTGQSLLLPLVLGSEDGEDIEPGPPITAERFGVQMYGDTRSETLFNAYALESRAGTVRVPYTWPNTAPEQPRWHSIDKVFGIAMQEHGGLNIVATLERVPDWAAPDRYGPLYPEHYPAMAEFMGQVVERFDGDGIDDAPGSPVITYWEMYNEPDRGSSWNPEQKWGHNGDVYAMMLRTIYPAMKAANPDAKIVMGGLAYDWFEDQDGPFVRTFIDDVLTAGGCDYFDVMNIHSFPFYANRWTDNSGAGVYEKTKAVQDKLAEYGCDRPMIITESGWHSDEAPWNPSDFEEQARYVPQIFVQSFAAGVDITVWWMLYDPPENYWDNGLVTDEEVPQRKPSFSAYQTVREMLLGTGFGKRYTPEELPSDLMELYRFEDDDNAQTVYVAWLNPVESEETITYTFDTDEVTIVSLYGDLSARSDTDDHTPDGATTVQITSQPIYIVVPRQ